MCSDMVICVYNENIWLSWATFQVHSQFHCIVICHSTNSFKPLQELHSIVGTTLGTVYISGKVHRITTVTYFFDKQINSRSVSIEQYNISLLTL